MAAAMRWNKWQLITCLFAGALLASANTRAQSAEYNYLLHCGGCHIEDGSGLPPHVPDLRVDMPYFATFTEGRAYIARVPGVVHAPMTSEQLTGVLNMVLERFAPAGSKLQPYTVEEVVLYQQQVMLDPQKLRDQLAARKADLGMAHDVSNKGIHNTLDN